MFSSVWVVRIIVLTLWLLCNHITDCKSLMAQGLFYFVYDLCCVAVLNQDAASISFFRRQFLPQWYCIFGPQGIVVYMVVKLYVTVSYRIFFFLGMYLRTVNSFFSIFQTHIVLIFAIKCLILYKSVHFDNRVELSLAKRNPKSKKQREVEAYPP